MLDHLTMLPLVFPAIILGVAFLNIFVNMPLPLYGTLLSVIIASSVRYLSYGMRYAYAGALQIHPDLEGQASVSGASGASRVPAHRAAAIGADPSQLVVAGIPAVGPGGLAAACCWLGPGSEVMAVTLFELWQNGQVTELASMGVLWMLLMTAVSAVFHLLTRRHQMTV